MNRRNFISIGLLAGAAVSTAPYFSFAANNNSLPDFDQWQLTNKQWRSRLTDVQYDILRDAGTERAYSNAMEASKKIGTYHCAGCDLAAYSSEHKYESGTGWPSFWQPIDLKFVDTKTDFSAIWPRTEVHCARCGGHQGHIFKDGPQPTGLRYCLNSASIIFKPA
ncbi:MAG: peptide-methionine (R)-S-oxide reductase MsrB [Rhizobiales bacterium]|nr:peptide-methionine (R)-S-oxide reductase MsrB [Hyphomicrobiales bacterium]NRB14450.1 peptide-methionine (R)-S-oxide reductase MsrB [Hyphomicrobiales bacterium]